MFVEQGVMAAPVEHGNSPSLLAGRGVSVAITVCLMAGLLLSLTGTGLAISGFASTGPAVRAQYPDDRTLAPSGNAAGLPPVATLRAIIRQDRNASRRPGEARRFHRAELKIRERSLAVLPTSSKAGVQEYGSISLLVGGMVILSVGGLLRWRRTAAGY
jgi:hypothetical protein